MVIGSNPTRNPTRCQLIRAEAGASDPLWRNRRRPPPPAAAAASYRTTAKEARSATATRRTPTRRRRRIRALDPQSGFAWGPFPGRVRASGFQRPPNRHPPSSKPRSESSNRVTRLAGESSPSPSRSRRCCSSPEPSSHRSLVASYRPVFSARVCRVGSTASRQICLS